MHRSVIICLLAALCCGGPSDLKSKELSIPGQGKELKAGSAADNVLSALHSDRSRPQSSFSFTTDAAAFFGNERIHGDTLYSEDLGWLFVEQYPWVYSSGTESWLFVHETTESFVNGSWFYCFRREFFFHTQAGLFPWAFVIEPANEGWLSGACCLQTLDWGAWRGDPATVAAGWADVDDGNQRYVWVLDYYTNWTGSFDLAPGFFVGGDSGENMRAAAEGDYEERWREAMQNVYQKAPQMETLFIRPAHEMNGNWYPWSVTPENKDDFIEAWRRYYRIIQEELVDKGVDARVTMGYNKDPVNEMHPDDFWPGDEYVDVIGVDYYDMYPSYFTQQDWDSQYYATRAGGPYGIGAWRAYAEERGKPLAFPEWGTHPGQMQDNPFFILKMNEFMRDNAGSGPGQVLYDCYFNAWEETRLHPDSYVPEAAAAYQSLRWGVGSYVKGWGLL